MKIHIAPTAFKDIDVASDWWRRNRLAAPRLFEEELRDALGRLADMPFTGQRTREEEETFVDVWRFYLSATRYFLYYRVDERADVVQVLRLWHASRGSMPKLP